MVFPKRPGQAVGAPMWTNRSWDLQKKHPKCIGGALPLQQGWWPQRRLVLGCPPTYRKFPRNPRSPLENIVGGTEVKKLPTKHLYLDEPLLLLIALHFGITQPEFILVGSVFWSVYSCVPKNQARTDSNAHKHIPTYIHRSHIYTCVYMHALYTDIYWHILAYLKQVHPYSDTRKDSEANILISTKWHQTYVSKETCPWSFSLQSGMHP